MTAIEAYDLAVEWWGARAAAVQFGERYIVGLWVPAGEVNEGSTVVLSTTVLAVVAWGEGDSWAAAVDAARARSR